MLHVVPLNDDREHYLTPTCWCHPLVQFQDEQGIILPKPIAVHDAADCRQQVERLLNEGIGRDKMWAVLEQ